MNLTHVLYMPEDRQALRAKGRRFRLAAIIVGILTLIVCVRLCFGITTRDAALRLALVIACSTLGSFVAVCLLEWGMLPARREASHAEGILQEAEEPVSGRIQALAPAFSIPKSITFHTVSLETEHGPRQLKLNARFRRDFPAPGKYVRLAVRRGYIAAWEVDAK